jgi:hypothetical protein
MAAALGLAGTAYLGVASGPGLGYPPAVTITAHDYSYDPIPDIPAGVVEIQLHNAGKDIHHAIFFKLAPGKTGADLAAALKNPGPPPAWAEMVVGPNAPAPGEFSNVIVDLKPGNYVAMCFVESNGGIPHFVKGMVRDFKVVDMGNKATMPAFDTHLELYDYNFKFSKPVTAGAHTFHVMNSATQPHEVELFKLAPGKTVAELTTWMMGPMTSEPPGIPMGGIVGLPPHSTAQFHADIPAGEWALMCFLPDPKDGKPHFMHGMEMQFSVK